MFKYFYECYGNRELPESEQGFAEIIPLSAKDHSSISNHLVSEAVRAGKGSAIKIDMAQKSLEINRKNCPKVFNIKNPMTETTVSEMTIDQVYESGELRDLYEELSNAVGDISKLKEGIKKK
jgi:hypothetical protein